MAVVEREFYIKSLKRFVTCSIVKENSKTLLVRLPDGNVIKRHKRKQSGR